MRTVIRVTFQEPAKPKKYMGWRCLHEAEGGYDSADAGLPEVRPSFNAPPVEFTKPMQLLSWDLNTADWEQGNNDLFTRNNWRTVYKTNIAFTNNQGYDEPGDPRCDWINMRDLTKKPPKLMKAILCGGAFVRAVEVGNNLWMYPGVHAIDAQRPIPSMDYVIEHTFYFAATTQFNGKMSHFPQGHGHPVWIPYILEQAVSYPKSWFVRWEEDFLPDPLKLYLTR